ncbi:MAG: response regulator [Myxococcales bacterium]|nr:response regulator [Myxococcales bacterium]MDD9971129.1 response regulator [Myxococcales bacterium]
MDRPSLTSQPYLQSRILVVDDEQEIRALLTRHLAYEGLKVTAAASGKEALEVMEEGPAHVVATDITMPRMNGLKLMEVLRERYPATRIVAMTGRTSEETIRACMQRGADACVLKPLVDMDEFVRTVRHSLAIHAHWEAILATVQERARSIGERPSQSGTGG